jgi:hypothetical protein
MPSDNSTEFTLNILLPKSSGSAETRSVYKNKLQAWLTEEKKTMPFEKMASSKTQVSLMSKDFVFLANFQKKTLIVFGAKKPMQNIDKLNDVSNRICAYLNTIMPQEVKEAEVTSDFSNIQKGKVNFAKKIIGDARMAKVSEILKIPWNPMALAFQWKADMRENIAMCGKFRTEEGLFLMSHFKWENNLPLDAVIAEKKEFLKLQEMVSTILKEEI